MRLNDLFDPRKGADTLVKLALYSLVLIVVWQVIASLLYRISASQMFLALLFLVLTSPVAYLIRKARGHRSERGGGRRGGAERTPLLPQNGHEE